MLPIIQDPEPPALYHADAVNFDGSTWTVNAALVAGADAGRVSGSVWFRQADTAQSPVYWVVDPENNYSAGVIFGTDRTEAKAFGTNVSTSRGLSTAAIGITAAVYLHLLFSINNDVGGTPKMAAYLTDVLVGTPTDDHVGPDASDVVSFNGLPLWVGADSFGDNFIGDMADLWIAPGVSLLDAGGAIPEAVRRNFITADGKPVDPAIFTGLYGAGAVLLSGNAASFGTNQGTGGAFTTTGTLTNASSSPSD